MNSISSRLRLWSSHLSSLFLLFQRSPIIQLIFPEAKILGGSAIADTATLAIATIAGLGAYDSVSGATSVLQVSPLSNSSIVPAATGSNLNFVYNNSNTQTPGSYQITSGTLPTGLTKGSTIGSGRTQVISGTPTQTGAFPITLTAWEFSNNTGRSTTGSFTIYVLGFSTQPAATTVLSSGSNTTLSCAVNAAGVPPAAVLSYQWYQGTAGITTTAVGTNSASYTTPALSSDTNYWVKVSSTLSTSTVTVNSTASAIIMAVPAALTTQPSSVTINSGTTTTLSVVASGTAPLTYQWYQGASGTTTSPVGSNSASYITPALTTSTNYWVKVTNSANPTGASSTTAAVTVRNQFDSWMNATGAALPANLIGPLDIPRGDGVSNLLKFACNLNPNISDCRRLTVGSGNTAGLPASAMVAGKLRLEFIRRKSTTTPGITYTPQFGSDPSIWTNATSPAATSIDTTWERVVVDDPAPTGAKRFGRVAVTQTP